MTLLEQILEVIVNTSVFESKKDLNRVLYGLRDSDETVDLKTLNQRQIDGTYNIVKCVKELVNEKSQRQIKAKDYEVIAVAFNRYLRTLPANASYKQKLREDLIEWLMNVSVVLKYELADPKNEVADFGDEDRVIAFVKALHGYPTRSELAKDVFGDETDVESVKKYLGKIMPTTEKNRKKPLMLAGQKVYVDWEKEVVERQTKPGHPKYRYHTPNTLHPIVLQENLYQVYVLLRSLQIGYDSMFSDVGRDIATDVWSQLSDYAKKRIKEVFCEPEMTDKFGEFLCEVEENLKSNRHCVFYTEEGMLYDSEFPNANIKDKINIMVAKREYLRKNYTVDVYQRNEITKNTETVKFPGCKVKPIEVNGPSKEIVMLSLKNGNSLIGNYPLESIADIVEDEYGDE